MINSFSHLWTSHVQHANQFLLLKSIDIQFELKRVVDQFIVRFTSNSWFIHQVRKYISERKNFDSKKCDYLLVLSQKKVNTFSVQTAS